MQPNQINVPTINFSPLSDWDIGPKYQIIRPLGYGSYGSVCDALNLETKTRVAIKKCTSIFSNPLTCKGILREIELLYTVKHPCIVMPYEVFLRNGNDLYIVMEIAQVDLHYLRQNMFLIDKQIKAIMYRILLALNYLHSGGIVHRDLKPANILINTDCSVKICDFSLGRSITGLTSSNFDCCLEFKKHPDFDLSDIQSFYPKTQSEEDDMNYGEVDEMREEDKKSRKTVYCEFHVKFAKTSLPKSCETCSQISKRSESPPKIDNVSAELKKKQQRQILLTSSKVASLTHERELTGHIATRSYRPPEIILLERVYTTAVDMWAAGCVFAELLEMNKDNQPDISKRSPLFPGKSCFPLSPSANPTETVLGMPVSPNDQLRVIISSFSQLDSDDLNFLNDQRAEDYVNALSKNAEKNEFKKRLPAATKDELDLLGKMLEFNPYYRITAKEALAHPYFAEVRNKALEYEIPSPITLLTDSINASTPQMLANEVLGKISLTK